ncbi:hypothetical protein F2Q69_00004454 [Brassica cretica]|uniref:Uncharacterized protein n=1 Tax=Brassica cretica TaxID=69181 RepID=A0A8S9NSM8_BRACR|nr:hypothetical protein F2Q69_00004454 [Brassica cretica]
MVEIVIDTVAENIVRKGNVRETILMIMIRGLSIEKERRGTCHGHALARAAALNAAAGKHSEDDGTISIDRLPHRKRSFDRDREERHMPRSRSRSSSRS